MKERYKIKRPTQRSIADAMGISVAAVSRALANDPLISAETRSAVNQKAVELGYVPDRAAQRLRTGRSNVISLILPPHEELLGFGTSLVRGISQALANSQYHLVVMPDFGSDSSFETIKRVVDNRQADGMILSRTVSDDLRVRYLLEKDFPFVTHGRTELATPHAFVDYDNFGFAYQAVKDLCEKGIDEVMILLPPKHLMFCHHLHQGFKKACMDFNLVGNVLNGATLFSKPAEISKAVSNSFDKTSKAKGLILPGDTSALAAMAALQDSGHIIGKDVHLVVKQTSGVFGYVRPPVRNVFEDITQAGKLMTEYLLQRISGISPSKLQTILGEMR